MVNVDIFLACFLSFSLQKEEDKKSETRRKLGPVFDSKKANLGAAFDSTAYLYTHTRKRTQCITWEVHHISMQNKCVSGMYVHISMCMQRWIHRGTCDTSLPPSLSLYPSLPTSMRCNGRWSRGLVDQTSTAVRDWVAAISLRFWMRLIDAGRKRYALSRKSPYRYRLEGISFLKFSALLVHMILLEEYPPFSWFYIHFLIFLN